MMFWQHSTLCVHISDFDKVMNQQLTTTPVKYILVGWLQVLQECLGVRMSHHEILHFFSISTTAAVHHLKNSETEVSTAVNFTETFCIKMLNFVQISRTVAGAYRIFSVFQVKCKNSLDDRT